MKLAFLKASLDHVLNEVKKTKFKFIARHEHLRLGMKHVFKN
jgi:hypothetical protein